MPDIKEKRLFKLGTTSFIVPDHIVPNVEFLGPYFDEIELLVFESKPSEVIPPKQDVKRLQELSEEYDLSYNIHLPVDIDLAHPDKKMRQRACDTMVKVFERFDSLTVSTHTLHLAMDRHVWEQGDPKEAVKQWQQNAWSGVDQLLKSGIHPETISVETLDYPFEYVEPIIKAFGLKVCIDAGHQIKYGYDLENTFEISKGLTPLIHLHGVDVADDARRDHLGLDVLPRDVLTRVKKLLSTYDGVVSLEVFGRDKLIRSLSVLTRWFYPIPEFPVSE